MKHFLILFFILNFSFDLIAQKTINYKSIPAFSGCNFKENSYNKIQKIKDNTLLFISENISKDFLRPICNVNDTIIFSYQYTINKKGIVIPEKTKVQTSNQIFTKKIKNTLNKLPRFTPSRNRNGRSSLDFVVNEIAEFNIDSLYKLKPIYRKKIYKTLNTTTSDKKTTEIYRNKNKNKIIKWPISNIVHFTLSEAKKIEKIRVLTHYPSAVKLVETRIKKLDSIRPTLIDSLQSKNNYSIELDLYIKEYQNYQ